MSEVTNLYRCKPRKLRELMIDVLDAGLVPFITSSPGMGKSAITHSVANDFLLHMIDHRLSTSTPEDMTGLPRFNEKGEAVFAPFAELFPLESNEIPEGKNGWMLFLDEFNSAPKSIQAPAYKLILDRMTGQKKLHKHVAIVAAGNLATDRAIVNPISTALQSRMVHLELQLDFEEWLMDVALAKNFDKRIIAFLSQYPSKLMDFKPDHNEKTFCCPRTWEFMNRLVSGKAITDDKAALYAGTITSGVAVELIQFTKVFSTMVKVEDILRDPVNTPLPHDNATRWAVISSMMEKVNDKTFTNLAEYANRFSMDFRVLFYRSTMIRQPDLRKHPAFAKAMSELTKYLSY